MLKIEFYELLGQFLTQKWEKTKQSFIFLHENVANCALRDLIFRCEMKVKIETCTKDAFPWKIKCNFDCKILKWGENKKVFLLKVNL